MNLVPNEEPPAGDWYLDAIDEMERSAQDLKDALDRTIELLQGAREERLSGDTIAPIVRRLMAKNGLATRRAHDEAFRVFTATVTAYRAAVVRALIDDDAMTFSEVAKLLGVSRQMIGACIGPPRSKRIRLLRNPASAGNNGLTKPAVTPGYSDTVRRGAPESPPARRSTSPAATLARLGRFGGRARFPTVGGRL